MKEKLNYIQSLRGFAALLVFFYHGKSFLNGLFGLNLGDILFSRGALGVEIFFIISGFIMVITTQKREINKIKFSPSIDFFIKRLIRIAPLYYLMTFCWIILSGKLMLYFIGNLKMTLITSLLFIPYTQFPIVLVGWSLNYEMFFYLLFAVSLINHKFRFQLLMVFYITILLVRHTCGYDSFIFKMITDPIIDYFVIGILFGLFYKKIQINDKILNILSVITTLLLVFLLLKIINTENHYIVLSILSVFTLNIILLDFKTIKTKPPKTMIFLGDISYSFYLIHLFVIILITRIVDKFHISKDYGFLLFSVMIIIITIVSKITNKFIENHFSKYLSNKIFAKKIN